jgi:hypothetical protein
MALILIADEGSRPKVARRVPALPPAVNAGGAGLRC